MKMWPRRTVDGAVKDMVRPVKGGVVVVEVVGVVREAGRAFFGIVIGRELDRSTMLAVEGTGRLLGRVRRWESCEDGPKRVFGVREKSTLLRQRMVMIGLQVLEIWRVDSRTISSRPIPFDKASTRGSGVCAIFAVGWTL